MPDRIDRSNPATPYQITRAKDAKEEDQRQRGRQDESSFRRISDWERYFLTARQEQKTLEIPLAAVREIRYRNSTVHKGSVIFHVDLLLRDGTFQTGCLFQHPGLGLLAKVQSRKAGDCLPIEWFEDLGTLHVTLFLAEIPREMPPGAAPGESVLARSLKLNHRFWLDIGVVDRTTGRVHIGLALLYGAMGLMIVSAAVLLIQFLLFRI